MDHMQAVIYTRVSQDRRDGRSVQDQERECRAECERKGWPVREVFCDNDIGASRHSGKARPEWEKLKAEIRPGDIVVMWESSRSTRDVQEHIILRNLCADLDVPLSYGGKQLDMSEAEDRFIGVLDAALAEREAEVLRRRVLLGKRSAAAKGTPYGRPPWGLRRADTVEVKWEHDPVEAPRLREAMNRVLEGKSMRSVLAWLRSTDGYSPTDVTGLRRGLCNPAVAGLRIHQARGKNHGGGQISIAKWPAIVSKDEQDRVAATGKRRPEPRGLDPIHLMTGIATCGVCDTGLKHKRTPAKPGKQDTYAYRCPNGHVSRSVVLVDGLALAELVKGFAGETPPADDAEARAAQAEIDDIENELAKNEALVVAREMSGAAFARIEQGMLARIEELRPLTVKPIPNPYEYMKISTEDYMAASVPERRAMMRTRLNVKVYPVPAGTRKVQGGGQVVITRR
jgi:site-specific DNA recombinase